MSNTVDRLKELLFDSETSALKELYHRISEVAHANSEAREDLLKQLQSLRSDDTRGREELNARLAALTDTQRSLQDELAQRIASIAELDARARDTLKVQIDNLYNRAGTDENLTHSVAQITSEALRAAEVERHSELSQSIAPLVISTIKTELRNSQDEMVEALYPITGRLVKSYVASAIKDLTEQMNRRLEQNPIMLRLQSLTTGRSVGELALASSRDFEIRQLYLIRRGTGELVAHWPDNAMSGREHAMSGVLAAINEFASEAFSATDSSLRQIDLGDEEVYLRGSPLYLLAARCSGQAPKAIEQTIDDTFLLAVESQVTIDGTFEGLDAEAARSAALADIGQNLQAQVSAEIENLKRPAGTGVLIALAAIILLPVLGYLAWGWYTDYAIAQTRATAQRIISTDPAMLGYPVEIAITSNGKELTVSGLTPSQQAKTRIVTDLRRSLSHVALSDKLSVVAGSGVAIPDVSPELERVRHDVATAVLDLTRAARTRVNARANARLQQAKNDLTAAMPRIKDRSHSDKISRIASEIEAIQSALRPIADTAQAMTTSAADEEHIAAYLALTHRLNTAGQDLLRTIGSADPDAVLLTDAQYDRGSVDMASEQFAAGTERIAALAATIAAANALRPEPARPVVLPEPPSPRQKLGTWASSHAIFFSDALEYRDPDLVRRTLTELATLMKPAPALLRIVGYTDDMGSPARNVQLARDRAEKVRRDLLDFGVPAEVLVTVGRADALELSDANGTGTPNRRVQFEVGFEGEAYP